MGKFLRFGEIPETGKSVNFLKMSFSQVEDFTFFCENGDMIQAYDCVPEDAYEVGLSVFEIDKNGMPVLENLKLITSLLTRINDKIYLVEGNEVGRGHDGEPLISDVLIIKIRRIKKETLLDYILEILLKNFNHAKFDKNAEKGEKLHQFYCEYKINKKTGEKVSIWEQTEGKEWVKVPPVTEYTFMGWTFSEPVVDFKID